MSSDERELFACSGSGGVVPTTERRHLRVDIHCHVQCPAADDLARPHFRPEFEPFLRFASDATREVNREQVAGLRQRMTSVELRLQEMDAAGIDIQALSPSPGQYHYWAEPELARETARIVNNGIADTVATHPDRFVGLGTVPLQHPDFAVAELDRLVKDCGLRGIEIGTNVNGTDLSTPALRPVFARAEQLGVLIFLHPAGFTDGRRLADHYLINIIGNPLESTIAVSHLIFGGVLKEHPGLKICVAHGGGYLPTYAGRMDHAHRARPDCRLCIEEPPSTYLRRLYFDTVVYSPAHLALLVSEYGADHVLMGTDYPYDMAEADPVGLIAATEGLSEGERALILGGNAGRLLGLDAGVLSAQHAARTG